MFGNVKQKYCCRFWPFPRREYRFIGEYLSRQESKGLRLCFLISFLSLAVYKRVEPQKADYCVDIFRPKPYAEIQPYLDLCEEAGWEIIWQMDQYKIFRRKDGVQAALLQSDPAAERELEAENMKKEARNAGLLLAWLLFLTFIVVKEWDWISFYLSSYAFQLIVLLFGAVVSGQAVCFFDRLWQWRRIGFERTRQTCREPAGAMRLAVIRGAAIRLVNVAAGAGIWAALIFCINGNQSAAASLIGALIGLPLGALLRWGRLTSGYGKERRMKGVCSAKSWFICTFLFIAVSGAGILYMQSHEDILPPGNFYMESIKRDRDSTFSLMFDDQSYTARTEKTADRLWMIFDKKLCDGKWSRERLDNGEYVWQEESGERGYAYKEIQTSQQKREEWSFQEMEENGYGGYDRAFYYPEKYRLLLKKGRTLELTDYPTEEKAAGF